MNENEFTENIKRLCGQFLTVREQFNVGQYRIDIYLIEPRIAIEFDEPYHNNPVQKKTRLS